MLEIAQVIKVQENLPPNMYDLTVDGNIEAALKKLAIMGVKLKVARSKPGYWVKRRIINGRPYWYRVHKEKVDGKWKNIEEYLGSRKPRGV